MKKKHCYPITLIQQILPTVFKQFNVKIYAWLKNDVNSINVN